MQVVKSEKSTSQDPNTFFSLGNIHNQTHFLSLLLGLGLRFPLASVGCDDYQTLIYTQKCEIKRLTDPY